MSSPRRHGLVPFVLVAALLCAGLSWLAERDDAAALAAREAHDLAALHTVRQDLPEGLVVASLPIDARRARRAGLAAFGFLVGFAVGHRVLSRRLGPWLDLPLLAVAGAALVRLPLELTHVAWAGTKSSPLAVHASAQRLDGLARALAEDLTPEPALLEVWGWRLVASAVVVHGAALVVAQVRRGRAAATAAADR